MITLLHGEDYLRSRQYLIELLDQAKEQGKKVARLVGNKLSLAELEEALQGQDLFGQEQLVVIEELHKGPRSKKKTALIELASRAPVELIIWEPRKLSKTQLNRFSQAKVQSFKIANSLFKWLDSLQGQAVKTTAASYQQKLQLLQQAIKDNGDWLCFAMLIRQVRLLVQTKDGGQIKGPPFVTSKLRHQARSFQFSELLALHQRLLEIDIAHKTSTNQLQMAQELDLLLLKL